MGDFVVLKDNDVYNLLISLPRKDILSFKHAIQDCLVEFSTSDERSYQPSPGVINRPNGQKTLFRPFTSPANVGTKIIVDPAPSATGAKQPLHGVLVVCDHNGLPQGIMNAEELTGYRTSMSVMIPFLWREKVERIVVYGAGKQALWHVRLPLALRGEEIVKVSVINRSRERTRGLVETIRGENEERWKAQVEFEVIDGGDHEACERVLGQADVVFCTVPSTEPLFPAQWLLEREKKEVPLVTAIGSWQPQMIELDPDLLKFVVKDGGKRKVIVDDRESCLSHTGEVIRSELVESDLVEIGQIVGEERGGEQNSDVKEWLATGLVVYKSVGVGVTDLISGSRILSLAKERGLGTTVKGL